MESRKPVTTAKLRSMKQKGTPIAMITAYDYPTAQLAEQAGADVILVGDSLGNVVLGYDSTLPVTIDDMIYHSRAVARGVRNTFVVADMPFLTYHGSLDSTLAQVGRLMREGGCKAVKLEGGEEIADTVKAVVAAGVPVLGHIGFTPQAVHQIGGYKIQGKSTEQADRMLKDAKALEAAGAFAIVLEMVTEELAALITKELSIPTIGIGAGRGCDGQVLVFHDVVQYTAEPHPKKFVKTYVDVGSQIRTAISQYVSEVKSRAFPDESHTFALDDEVVQYLYGSKKGDE
ncbi:3-methyl-2-oxobutanoate hydroxymethyltransferase [Paenibacillus turpanensis]|uniref:3-methyl-2-oxobutanoate hydroxymethyltransferase n=1 Tax=Paenibacillus turpanensis TaxID=2689078 RepID=UPI00140CA1D4|nr:3-methyl-2-oxobutanoate hydroxymethyltransferase [Paenibacillus turpanensis]